MLFPGEIDEDLPENPLFGHLPPVLTEFNFKNMKIHEIRGGINYTSPNRWYTRAEASYGKIWTGTTRHSDYEVLFDAEGDVVISPRHDHVVSIEYSRTHGKIEKGHTLDLTGGFGYRFTSSGGRFWAAPVIGYSYHEQLIDFHHLIQTVNTIDDTLGAITNLRGKYHTHWFGVWTGMDFLLQLQCDVTVFGGGEWHFVKYRGTGSWNYNNVFDMEFHHQSMGYGAVANLGFDYEILPNISIGIVGKYQQWSIRKGKQKSDVILNTVPGEAFGTLPTNKELRLSRVTLYSWSSTFIVAYRF